MYGLCTHAGIPLNFYPPPPPSPLYFQSTAIKQNRPLCTVSIVLFTHHPSSFSSHSHPYINSPVLFTFFIFSPFFSATVPPPHLPAPFYFTNLLQLKGSECFMLMTREKWNILLHTQQLFLLIMFNHSAPCRPTPPQLSMVGKYMQN